MVQLLTFPKNQTNRIEAPNEPPD